MLRSIALALGLAVVASAAAAEEFLVHVNDVSQEAGAAVAPSVADAAASNLVATASLPENVQLAILNARGELSVEVENNPFR